MRGRASTEIPADRDDTALVPTRMAEIQKAPVKRLSPFDVLIGLRLSIIRRAADMLVLHFGPIRRHPSGTGTVADYALHVQCPWRLDGPNGTVTGRDDLWEYAGPGQRPLNWSPDDGLSLQDQKFANLSSGTRAHGPGLTKATGLVSSRLNKLAAATSGSIWRMRMKFYYSQQVVYRKLGDCLRSTASAMWFFPMSDKILPSRGARKPWLTKNTRFG